MIDIHMHILPGLDDGAGDLYDALDMADMAVHSGIHSVIATSHSSTDRWYAADYDYAFERLHTALQKENIPLKLYPGTEVLMEEAAIAYLQNGQFRTLNHTNYVLFEYRFDITAEDALYYVRELRQASYLPVLAHAERFDFMQEEPDRAEELRRLGVALQINKGSLSGAFGWECEELAAWLLRQGLADLVATDAHNIYDRTPYMGNAQNQLDQILSPEAIYHCLEESPAAILKGQPIPALSLREVK